MKFKITEILTIISLALTADGTNDLNAKEMKNLNQEEIELAINRVKFIRYLKDEIDTKIPNLKRVSKDLEEKFKSKEQPPEGLTHDILKNIFEEMMIAWPTCSSRILNLFNSTYNALNLAEVITSDLNCEEDLNNQNSKRIVQEATDLIIKRSKDAFELFDHICEFENTTKALNFSISGEKKKSSVEYLNLLDNSTKENINSIFEIFEKIANYTNEDSESLSPEELENKLKDSWNGLNEKMNKKLEECKDILNEFEKFSKDVSNDTEKSQIIDFSVLLKNIISKFLIYEILKEIETNVNNLVNIFLTNTVSKINTISKDRLKNRLITFENNLSDIVKYINYDKFLFEIEENSKLIIKNAKLINEFCKRENELNKEREISTNLLNKTIIFFENFKELNNILNVIELNFKVLNRNQFNQL